MQCIVHYSYVVRLKKVHFQPGVTIAPQLWAPSTDNCTMQHGHCKWCSVSGWWRVPAERGLCGQLTDRRLQASRQTGREAALKWLTRQGSRETLLSFITIVQGLVDECLPLFRRRLHLHSCLPELITLFSEPLGNARDCRVTPSSTWV